MSNRYDFTKLKMTQRLETLLGLGPLKGLILLPCLWLILLLNTVFSGH